MDAHLKGQKGPLGITNRLTGFLAKEPAYTGETRDRDTELIITLNRVAAHTSSSNDMDEVLQIIADEFHQHGLEFYLTVMEDEGNNAVVRFVSPGSKILKAMEKLFNRQAIGAQIPQENLPAAARNALTRGRGHFVENYAQDAAALFNDSSPALMHQALKLLKINDNTSGVHIPMDLSDGTKAMLTIWGDEITERNLPTFSIFAAQIASAFERMRIYEAEQAQNLRLERSNRLINALAGVAAEASSARSTIEVLSRLETELYTLGLDFLLLLVDAEGKSASMEFMSLKHPEFSRERSKMRQAMKGVSLDRGEWPALIKTSADSETPQFSDSYMDLIPVGLLDRNEPLVEMLLNKHGSCENTRIIVIPRKLNDGRTAVFSIWGKDVQAEDLSAFSVFAAQVANTYERSILYETEQRQARNLEHSNALMEALSHLTARVAQSYSEQELMAAMHEELHKIGLNYVYLNVNADEEKSEIQYISIGKDLLDKIHSAASISLKGMGIPMSARSKESVQAIRDNRSTYMEKFTDYVDSLFADKSDRLRQTIFKWVNLTAQSSAIFLPIMLGNKNTYLFIIWGDSISEKDLPAFNVYKSQMESILETIRLFQLAEKEVVERRTVESELLKSQKELRGLFENANDAIIITDPVTGNILDANRRAVELFGYTKSELTAVKLESLTNNPQKLNKIFEEILEYETYMNFELDQIQKRSSRPIAVEISAGTVIYDSRLAIQSIHRDVSERKALEERLRHESLHDSLTQLPNRTLFVERLSHQIVRSSRSNLYNFAVLYLDLDRFKSVNDTLGHMAGDRLLVQLADNLKRCLRASDTIARIGGDEFAILLEQVDSVQTLKLLCERLLTTIQQPMTIRTNEISLSGSIGVVMGNAVYGDPEDYLRDADIAMYIAKDRGKARFEIFNISMRTSILERIKIENDLRKALDNKEFHLVYQPIYQLTDKKLVGFEALLRWKQPFAGLISPGYFISIAEDLGLIQSIGSWVLNEACTQLHAWKSELRPDDDFKMSINISALQLLRTDFPEELKRIIRDTGIQPGCLALEITETSFISNSELASKQVEAIKSIGSHIHLDDFGTGYSSLSFINLFQVDALKIERQFIANLGQEKQAELVKAIISLGENIGLKVIAEGIETQSQLAFLLDSGCTIGQGFYFSRPLLCEEAEELVKQQNLVDMEKGKQEEKSAEGEIEWTNF